MQYYYIAHKHKFTVLTAILYTLHTQVMQMINILIKKYFWSSRQKTCLSLQTVESKQVSGHIVKENTDFSIIGVKKMAMTHPQR